MFGVNLGGVINGVVTFVPRIKAHGEGGHVVNTASMASFLAGPGAGIYTAAKFGVRGISEALRYALPQHGIGVLVVCPGLVESNIYKSDEVRPAELSTDVTPADADFMAILPELHTHGMSGTRSARRRCGRSGAATSTSSRTRSSAKSYRRPSTRCSPRSPTRRRRPVVWRSRRCASGKAEAQEFWR